jgi:hypothetical protein
MMMKYVDRLAREIVSQTKFGDEGEAAGWAEAVLDAIAATGCKVTAREPTEAMCDAWWHSPDNDRGQTNWRDMHDAAPAYPEKTID